MFLVVKQNFDLMGRCGIFCFGGFLRDISRLRFLNKAHFIEFLHFGF